MLWRGEVLRQQSWGGVMRLVYIEFLSPTYLKKRVRENQALTQALVPLSRNTHFNFSFFHPESAPPSHIG